MKVSNKQKPICFISQFWCFENKYIKMFMQILYDNNDESKLLLSVSLLPFELKMHIPAFLLRQSHQ